MQIEEMLDNSKLILKVKDIKDIYNDLLEDIKKTDKEIVNLKELINKTNTQRICDGMGIQIIKLLVSKSEYIEAKNDINNNNIDNTSTNDNNIENIEDTTIN